MHLTFSCSSAEVSAHAELASCSHLRTVSGEGGLTLTLTSRRTSRRPQVGQAWGAAGSVSPAAGSGGARGCPGSGPLWGSEGPGAVPPLIPRGQVGEQCGRTRGWSCQTQPPNIALSTVLGPVRANVAPTEAPGPGAGFLRVSTKMRVT